MMTPRVVNVREAEPGTYVYVGRRCRMPVRGRDPGRMSVGPLPWLAASPFGNPFQMGMPTRIALEALARVGVRAQVRRDIGVLTGRLAVACYRRWLLAQPRFVARVQAELQGQVLGCWCAPGACHADVLLEVANGKAPATTVVEDDVDGQIF